MVECISFSCLRVSFLKNEVKIVIIAKRKARNPNEERKTLFYSGASNWLYHKPPPFFIWLCSLFLTYIASKQKNFIYKKKEYWNYLFLYYCKGKIIILVPPFKWWLMLYPNVRMYLKVEILIVQFCVLFSWHLLEFGVCILQTWTSYKQKVLCSRLWQYCKKDIGNMLWSIFPFCYLPQPCAPRFCTRHYSKPVFNWGFPKETPC